MKTKTKRIGLILRAFLLLVFDLLHFGCCKWKMNQKFCTVKLSTCASEFNWKSNIRRVAFDIVMYTAHNTHTYFICSSLFLTRAHNSVADLVFTFVCVSFLFHFNAAMHKMSYTFDVFIFITFNCYVWSELGTAVGRAIKPPSYTESICNIHYTLTHYIFPFAPASVLCMCVYVFFIFIFYFFYFRTLSHTRCSPFPIFVHPFK